MVRWSVRQDVQDVVEYGELSERRCSVLHVEEPDVVDEGC